MQTLLDEAQVLSKCLCKYLHQVLSTEPGAYGSEREKKREKRPEKGKRDAKRCLTGGGGWGGHCFTTSCYNTAGDQQVCLLSMWSFLQKICKDKASERSLAGRKKRGVG